METSDGVGKSGEDTMEFLTASELVSLRKPDEDSARCVIGEKYYTRSGSWLEIKAIACALENYKDTLNQKRAVRICDLMQAEWDDELNVSLTAKLKGKFIHHMGRPSNGKIALSAEESIFLLENGSVEISNGKVPLSTEEAYKIMLKGNLGAEKYQVYSQLSQLGFIVVPHQTDLGSSKYEKRLSFDKYIAKRKHQIISNDCEEPKTKRLNFTGVFSKEPSLTVNSTNQETSSTSITEILIAGPEFVCHAEESESSVHKIDDKIKESNVTEIQIEQTTKAVEDFSSCVGNFVTTVNEAEEVKEAYLSNTDVPDTNSNKENAPLKNAENTLSEDTENALTKNTENTLSKDKENTLSKDKENTLLKDTENALSKDTENTLSKDKENTLLKDTENEINAPISHSESTENSRVLDNELVTVEVGPDEETCVPTEDVNLKSQFDATSNPLCTNYEPEATSGISKNSIDVMNVDSQNTEISCASDVLTNNVSNANVTLEDSSCSVMDTVGIDIRDSNSDVMSCSSDNDEVLSVGVPSQCSFSGNVQEDDEIKLLEVTKKEIKPLAVIELSSDEDLISEYSNSDDDVQLVKVCNGVNLNSANPLESIFKKANICKKEERNSPTTTSIVRNNIQLSFPNCLRKEVVCISRPPVKYLPPNVNLSKEAYVINLKSKSSQSQPSSVLWGSFRDMQDYQRARRQNRHSNQSFSSFQSQQPSRRVDGFSSRDAKLRWRDPSENRPNPRADNLSHRDTRSSINHRRTNLPATSPLFNPYPPRDMKSNFNHGRNSEVFANSQNSERNSWLERNSSVVSREESPNFTHRRSMESNEAVYNNPQIFNSTNHFTSAQNLPPNPFRYGVPNASAAINSVVSVSNQDMNVSMVNNHIVHPPLHSSSPHLPSFNVNLPNLSAIGPMDIMAEVQRTAYSVATSMLSSMFGQNMNPNLLPGMPVFNTPQPQNGPFGFPSQFGPVLNTQNNSDPFSMQNQGPVRDPFFRPRRKNPFPCQFRNIRNRSSWNEVREAVGDRNSPCDVDESSNDDIEEVPMNPTDVLWDPKNICPLVKPGTKYLESDVLKMLQVSQMANLLSNSTTNTSCFSNTCSVEITFDVYLPGTNYKKTCPDVPKHRIIVVKSTDPIPKFSDIAFLQKKWNDGATLQLAVVDNGDISYQSFNSICLPVLIPHVE